MSGAVILALLGYLKARGVDFTSSLAALGLVPAELAKPDSRVAVESCEALWEHSAG